MSMTTQTPYYDFTPSEVNRIGNVAPEQRYRLTRALRLGVVAGVVMALGLLCALQQYAFNIGSRRQRGASEINGERFRVPEAAYDVLDESLLYRVYYLPRGNRLLSIEPAPVADETLA